MTNSEQLYNSLLNKGYTEKNIGDRDTFLTKMQDKENRRKLYDFISKRGDFRIGNYDSYEQRIASDFSIPQPLQENIALAMANPMDKVAPALRAQSAKPIGDVQASQNIGHRAEMTFNTPEQRSATQVIADNDAIINSSSLIDSKVPKDPQDAIQQAVSQDLIGKATSQEWQRDTLNSVSGMREEAKKKIKERAEELRNSGEDFDYSQWQQSPSQYGYAPMTTPGVKAPNLHSDREMNLYRLTIETLDEAQKHMETVRKNQSRNGFQQVAAGVGDAIFDIDTLTLGLDTLSKNATLKAILDKADADQPLTQAEESLLNAALYKQFTEAALPNGRWYNVGKGIGEQVPYMLEFALSGGVAGALTKGASKAIGKQVVKYINNLALKNGSKIAKRTARNVFTRGSRMLGNTLYQLPGGVMRAAVQVPLRTSVYNNIIERQIGTLGYKPGEDGTLDYTGRIDADNTADAITKGLTSGFITNLTESVGGEGIQFITNKIGSLMGKGANAVFKNLQSPRWYNRLRESFRRNGFGEFVKATSWQGPVAEYGEEILDQTLNAIFVGDSSLDPNSENYVFDLDNLIDTAITTGAISLFMGAAGGIASGKIHRDVNKAYALAEQNLRTLHYTDTEINALNNIATSRPQEASKWVSSITRTMRTLAIRSAEIENSLSPEARTLLSQPYTEAEFNELSPYDQQAVMALAEINSRFNDLTIQRDYVVAGINYNALGKGLEESVAPQAEAAMADIQANALRDSDYTVKVKFKGQDGYLVSGTADIDNLPDGRTVATLPAGNIYQVRTKSPDGQWIIQQAVAEDIVPGTVTPTQQLIDETTARIYTPVQNLITAEQAQAQAEVAQAQPSTPTGLNAPIGLNDSPTSEQVSEQPTTPADVKDTIDTKDSTVFTTTSPIVEQATPIVEQTTAPADVKDSIDSNGSTQSTEAQPLSAEQFDEHIATLPTSDAINAITQRRGANEADQYAQWRKGILTKERDKAQKTLNAKQKSFDASRYPDYAQMKREERKYNEALQATRSEALGIINRTTAEIADIDRYLAERNRQIAADREAENPLRNGIAQAVEKQPINTLEQYIARYIALGGRLRMTDQYTNGLAAELGITPGSQEHRELLSILSNTEGMTPEQLAQDMVENIEPEYRHLIAGRDTQDIRNAIINTIQSGVTSRKKAYDFIADINQRAADEEQRYYENMEANNTDLQTEETPETTILPDALLPSETTPFRTVEQPQPTVNDTTQAKLAHIASWQQAFDMPIVIFHDISEVDNPQAVANIQAGNRTPGWITNDTVYIYLPHAKDERDIDETIMHECIAHYGIKALFKNKADVDKFYDQVWHSMSPYYQVKFKNYPVVRDMKDTAKRQRAAADEYIAFLAEKIQTEGTKLTPAKQSAWQRIVNFLRTALIRAGVKLRITDADLNNMLLKAYTNLTKSVKTTNGNQNTESGNSRLRFIGEQGATNLDRAEEATTRLDNLTVARDMEQAGKDERTIKLATGWERGADNLWRYEIPDTPINQDALLNKHSSGATITILGSLINDDQLFKAYPQLYDMVVAFQELPLGELGNYSHRNAMGMPANIIMNKNFLSKRENPQWREEVNRMEQLPIIKKWSAAMEAEPFDMQAFEDAEIKFKESPLWEEYNTLLEGKGKYPRMITGIGGESTLAHEIQHAIQDIEGFARGGNERTANYLQDKARAWAWRNALVQTAEEHPELAGTTAIEKLLIDEYTQDGLQQYIPTEEQRLKGFNLYVRGYDNEGYENAWLQMSKIRPGDNRGTYRRLAGEVEARNVSHRLNFTPEERANTLARITEDVARKDQIFIGQALGNPAMGSRGIKVPQSEYAKIAHAIATYPDKVERGHVFTDNYYYLCTNIDNEGNFTVVAQLQIEGNEELINKLRGKDGRRNFKALEGTEDIASTVAQVKRRGGRTYRNISSSQRQTRVDGRNDNIHLGQQPHTASNQRPLDRDDDITTRFRTSNHNQDIFISNARMAVENIRQDKATPEQWLAMLQKNGGLKAGEDKWLGLSEWLKSQQGSITRSQILNFIDQNAIHINEVHYSQFGEALIDQATQTLEDELRQIGWDAMQEKYPGVEELFEYDGRELLWSENLASIGEYEDFILENNITGANPDHNAINETREQYTTPGLTDNHEIAITIPGIEPYKEYDDIHFGDAGGGRAIAWIRFGDTADSNGNPVLVIDEIQSKRHQDGREKGYRNEIEYRKVVKMLEDREPVIRRRLSEISNRLSEISNLIPSDIKGLMARSTYRQSMPEYNEWKQLREEDDALRAELQQLERTAQDMRQKLVPDAPFDKNWYELAFKRMLRYAAENGYEHLAWTTGTQQAERYGIGSYINELHRYESSVIADTPSRQIIFDFDENGIITNGEYEGNTLADVFGKETAVKILNMKPGDTLDGENLRIGGEGMKVFYDRMLPSFASKYVKKWGSKVQNIDLPSTGYTMHSVEITPEMRDSVMQGQTMFRSISPDESLTDYARAVVANSKQTPPSTGINAPVGSRSQEDLELIDAATDRFKEYFNAPEIIQVFSRAELRKLYRDMTDAEFNERFKEYEKIGAIYDADRDKIYTFVENSENTYVELIHEATHAAIQKLYNSENLKDKLSHFVSEIEKLAPDFCSKLAKAYSGDDYINELTAYTIDEFLEKKSLDDLLSLLSTQAQQELLPILKTIGYEKGRKQQSKQYARIFDTSRKIRPRNGVINDSQTRKESLHSSADVQNDAREPREREVGVGMDAIILRPQDTRTADTALDTIEQATADYADSLNTERGAIIDAITPAPDDSPSTVARKVMFRSIGRMVTRDNASMHLFDTLCNDVLANAARKNDKNALNAKRTSLEEKFTDNKVRVNQLLDKIQQGGGYIRPEDNYWYRENAHKASAQALSRLFKAKYESRLFEALAPIIRLLADNMNISAPKKGFIQNVKRGVRNTTERWYETLHQLADYLPFDKLRDRLLKSINDKLDDLNHTDYGRLYLTASYYMQAVTALERQKVKQEGKIAEQQTIIEDAKILADSQLIDVDKRIKEVQRSTELTDEEKAAQIDRLRLEKVRIAQTLEDTINETKEAIDVINEADYGGLAGVQYAIFDLYDMIDENVEAIKGDRQKLTVLAQELEIPTVEEFVKQVEDVIGSSQDANSSASQLWDAVRAISEYELETSYIAGLISRSGYQALTYNTDFDGLLKERYNQQKKAILDHPGSYDNINKFDEEGNLKSTRRVLNDNARIALNKLNQEYAKAIDAVPMPGKNGSWAVLVETGWLTQQEVDNIHRKYEHYLPLKGHAEMTAEDRNEYESHAPKNQSTIREAKGHTQLARDVITQIVQDALGTIQAAERNKALTLLYKTLTNNQDLAVAREQYKIQLTYYTLQRGKDGKMKQEVYNGIPTAEQLASGEVYTAQGRKHIANIDIPISNEQRDEHTVSVRVNGEDYTMFFYDKRIADAITGRNNKYPEHVINKALSWINKKMAAFITSLSPAFQLGSNMWRDIQEMFSNTIIDQGLLTAFKALGNRFNQLLFGKINKAVRRYQKGKLTPETARTATEKLVVEYFVNGGPVNITQLPDYDTVKLNVRNDLLQYLTTGEMPSDNSWLSRIAERVELASRLSVYIASRNIGKSVNEAIINSKEATVNFDRKGTEASLWGAYIMFFNAIMQGVRRQVQLWRNHPARALATYGFISFSIAPLSWMISHAFQQLICLITGDDDEPMSLDEMMEYYYSFSPEYRQRNFIIILGRDDSFRLPLALNYLPFSTIGDSFYRLLFDKNSRDDANDMALDVLSAFLETYTPVGQPLGFALDAIGADTPKERQQARKSFVGSILPPVFQPVAQNVFNYNFMGGQLYNEPFDENYNEPYYLKAKAHTQDIYINISQWLSNASGGDEVYAGDINLHPEQIENFFGLFGFFSEFTEQVLSVISMATDGEDNTLNDYWKSIPVLSRFTAGSPAEYKEKSLQGMFYTDKEELDRFKNIREAYIGTKKYDERVLQQYSPDEQRYFADLATMQTIAKRIRKEIKAATPEGEAPKYYEDERLKAIYNLANEQFHSLASGEYKPVDNPYYTYMYIKDAIEKAPHRTTDGSYRLIDRSERSADSRGPLKQLLQSFSKTRSMYKALPSGYYPGMPLDNREEQALNRFNIAVGELIQAYKNTDLDNLTPTDNAQ